MSVILFSTPAIEIVRSGEAQHKSRRSASAHNNLPEMQDHFDASLAAHATVGVLLQ